MGYTSGRVSRQTSTSALVLVLCGLGAPLAAHAQTAPAASDTPPPPAASGAIEEVTVTALRREQPLEQTPASVAVVTADTLEAAGVQNLTDVARLIPNLTFNTYYRAGVPYITLRGIPTSQGGEAPAAFIVDGAQAPGLDFINQDLLDIADIQVLRGPQGALYGRGAIAGAVLINTARPTDDYYDKLTLDYGNGDYFRALDTLSGPIIPDKLWGKVTLEDRYFGGLIEDEGLNRPGDWSRGRAGRVEILAKPIDGTTIDITAQHLTGVDGASYIDMIPGSIYNYQTQYPDRNLNTTDTRTMDFYIGRLDQETPFGTITSISQYAQSLSKVLGDADWTALPIAVQENNIQVRAFNQDLRFSTPADQPYQLIVGGFFQYRDTVNYLDVFGQAGGPLGGVTLAGSDDDAKSVAYAFYGQANADLPWGLKGTAALRFDVDDRFDEDRSVAGTAISTAFYALQPSGTLSKQFTDDLLGYVTIGRGFRSGGFNGYADTLAFPAVVKREFPKETNTNYEGGIKSQFLDKTLTVNASVYHTDYNNEQYYFISITPVARDIVSLHSVTINGGELEVDYKPIPPLSLIGSLGVADSTINSGDNAALNDVGKHSPNANTYNSDIAVEYRQPIIEDYNAVFRVDYERLGPIYYDPANEYAYKPTNYVNARIGLESNNYKLAVWGKNLTDTRAPAVFSPNSFGPGIGGRIDNEPTAFGVEFIAQFTMPSALPPATEPAPMPVPAAAPAPAPVPEAARQFQVFFDFDKSTITAAAEKVIQAASDAVKAGNVVHVTVTGHTDTVGSAKYNQALSERRAASVKAQMVTDGVSAGEIATIGVGKTALLVPTADGVREPQNRRAVIELQ